MNYNDLKEIAKSKNILVKDLASAIPMTRQGLQKVVDSEKIELWQVKKICEVLRISPSLWFDTGTYGVNITTGHVQSGIGNKIMIENKDKEIEMLKQRLADKDEIIKLLRERNNNNIGYGMVAEGK